MTVAVWVVSVQAAAEILVVATRDDFGPGGKVAVGSAFVLKVGCARWARRGSAGGVLGLLVFELVGIGVALGASWATEARLALAGSVVVVYGLVLHALRTFPAPELPPP